MSYRFKPGAKPVYPSHAKARRPARVPVRIPNPAPIATPDYIVAFERINRLVPS